MVAFSSLQLILTEDKLYLIFLGKKVAFRHALIEKLILLVMCVMSHLLTVLYQKRTRMDNHFSALLSGRRSRAATPVENNLVLIVFSVANKNMCGRTIVFCFCFFKPFTLIFEFF